VCESVFEYVCVSARACVCKHTDSLACFAGAQPRKCAMGRSTRPGTSPPAGHLGAASGLSVHVLVSTPAAPTTAWNSSRGVVGRPAVSRRLAGFNLCKSPSFISTIHRPASVSYDTSLPFLPFFSEACSECNSTCALG
jgi:hypothetical protein